MTIPLSLVLKLPQQEQRESTPAMQFHALWSDYVLIQRPVQTGREIVT
jgi:hypothetical protein